MTIQSIERTVDVLSIVIRRDLDEPAASTVTTKSIDPSTYLGESMSALAGPYSVSKADVIGIRSRMASAVKQ